MKHIVRFVALVCCSLVTALPLSAEITTGWIQTGAGPYDYNAPENWVGGVINGVFSEDLVLEAEQTITFDRDTELPNGLTFNHGGAFKIIMQSDDGSPHTLTLGGNIVNNASDAKGYVEPIATLNIDLGGTTRTISTTKAITLIHGIIFNGGIITAGAGELRLYGANTYADGTYISSSGPVGFINEKAFGTGTVTFCDGATLTNTKNITMTANNPLVFEGNLSYSARYNVNLGAGSVTIQKPCTFFINNGYTLGIGGQTVGDYDWSAVSKTGSGSLSTSCDVTLDGDTKTFSVSSGNWYFGGKFTGSGTIVKEGGAYFQLGAENATASFSGIFEIRAGSVRYTNKTALSSNMKFLILGSGVLRSNTAKECGYAYSAANLLPYVDTRSTGILGISSNESGDMNLTDYPDLIIAPNGGTFSYTGSITAPSTGVLRIGGGGQTLKLGGTITGATEIDASTGSIQFDASQPDFNGSVTVGSGYNLTLSNGVNLPNSSLEVSRGTLTFAGTSGGDAIRARDVTLKSATISLGVSSTAETVHRISGTLTISMAENGGSCVISGTGNADFATTLRAGAIVQDKPNFLKISATVLGESIKVVADTPLAGIDASGIPGTVTAPVIPWARAEYGAMLAYDATVGFRPLTASEQTVYVTSTDPVTVATAGENMYFYGATDTTFSDATATVNSISAIGASSKLAAKMTATGDFTVSSGAIGVYSDTGSKIECGSIDFGNVHGYIWGQTSGTQNATGTVKAAVKGNAGLTIGDGGMTPQSSQFFFNGDGSTYAGDTYIVGRVIVQGNGALPKGEERPGNLYLTGTLALTGTVNINGLYGSGTVTTHSSNGGTLNLGYDGSDGDFTGTFVNSTSANVNFNKYGSGTQRMAGPMAFKYNCVVYGGTLQIDGNLTVAREGNNVIVKNGGTLSGCGTITGYAYELVENGGTLAPGSAQKPNVPMTLLKELQMQDGASMKFHVGEDRVSQAIVAEGYGITGTATTIPVTVDCTVKKKGEWLLLEADTFNDKAFVFTTKPAGGRLVVKTDEATNRAQLWFEQTTGLYMSIR